MPTEVHANRRPNDAIWRGENFLVCYPDGRGEEVILQSEETRAQAERSVETLNEHERNHARPEKFYWRSLGEGEVVPRGEKHNLT